MNRYANYGRNDDPIEVVGDGQFLRLDMRSDPATLPPGSVQVSENFRFNSQGAQVRRGLANQVAFGDTINPIRWVGVYRPHNGNDQLALLGESAMQLFDPADQTITSVSYPGSETIAANAPVDFIQAGVSSGTTPDAYILRGLALEAMKFDGTTLATQASFKRGLFGLFYQDRIAVASGSASAVTSQQVDVSDFLDFTTWNLLNQFQVLQGGDDYLVGFRAYQKDLVIVGTRKQFFIAYFAPQFGTGGYDGGLSALNSYLRELTREGGLVGRRAWTEANGMIWFVSDNGIYAFQPQLDLELTVLGEPISKDIQPIMDRLSANYASGADVKLLGYRIYFALPINDEPIAITGLAVATGVATATVARAHNLTAGDLVQMTGAVDGGLNGTQTVVSATELTFTYATGAADDAEVGTRAMMQKIAQRNNRIAVFNLSLNAWESVDRLPAGIFADFLVVADYGPRRRLWVVDRTVGPSIYEEGEVDELNATTGGITLPFYLPAVLTETDHTAAPIPGRLKSRAYRWGPFPRQVRASEARLTLAAGDSGTVTTTIETPDRGEQATDLAFEFAEQTDVSARKRLGRRGLEASVEINVATGRPVVRTIALETVASGKVAEE